VGRPLDSDDLVGAAEIARKLNRRSRQSVADWRRRDPSFPQPVAELDMGNVWAWPDVEAWARVTGRLE
jgi:hypothetical protein